MLCRSLAGVGQHIIPDSLLTRVLISLPEASQSCSRVQSYFFTHAPIQAAVRLPAYPTGEQLS